MKTYQFICPFWREVVSIWGLQFIPLPFPTTSPNKIPMNEVILRHQVKSLRNELNSAPQIYVCRDTGCWKDCAERDQLQGFFLVHLTWKWSFLVKITWSSSGILASMLHTTKLTLQDDGCLNICIFRCQQYSIISLLFFARLFKSTGTKTIPTSSWWKILVPWLKSCC